MTSFAWAITDGQLIIVPLLKFVIDACIEENDFRTELKKAKITLFLKTMTHWILKIIDDFKKPLQFQKFWN